MGITIAQTLQPFRSTKSKWGYKNASGKIVVPAKYEFEAHPFSNGVAIVRNSGLKGYGVIDAAGNEIVSPQYTYAFDFVNGMAKVCTNGKDVYGTGGKWGFIDTKGKIIIPIQYDRIDGNFEDDSYASATLNGKRSIIDKTGATIQFATCDELYGTFYKSKIALAIKGKNYGMVDKTGKVIIPFEYETLYHPSDGLVAAKKGSLWGFIDEKNKWVIPPQFSSGGFFQKGFAVMHKEYNENGCINKAGKVTIPFKYSSMYPQSSVAGPMVVAKLNDKVGLMNPLTGKFIVSLQYDNIADFKENLAVVEANKKYGFVDDKGKEIVPPVYDYAASFYEGLAYVKLNNKYGYIDKTGKIVIPIEFDYVGEFQAGVASVTKDGKRYYIDRLGKMVTD